MVRMMEATEDHVAFRLPSLHPAVSLMESSGSHYFYSRAAIRGLEEAGVLPKGVQSDLLVSAIGGA